MSRTPIFGFLREVARQHQAAEALGRPVDEYPELAKQARAENSASAALSRRRFLVTAGALTAAAALPGRKAFARRPSSTPSVAIIGGGIAGLTTALRLRDNGVPATIYESQTRIGGRMLTEGPGEWSCAMCHAGRAQGRDAQFEGGQWADVFGELVDTNHATIHNLAARYAIPMINSFAYEPFGSTDTYYFDGGYYSRAQAVADFAPVYKAVSADLKAAHYPTTYNQSTAASRALDNMSVYDWIASRVPGGHQSRMGQLLDVAYAIEYGADTWDQSALNLVYLLAYQPKPVEFGVFGVSDEKYRIYGGSGALTDAIANEVGYDNIKLEWRLNALRLNSGGTYDLYFDGHSSVRADIVLLALPFTALRHLDISGAGFDALKLRAINEQGGAHNTKMTVQFNSKYWNQAGPWGISNGSTYSDTGFQCSWDGSRGLPSDFGMMVAYTGGSVTDATRLRHTYGNQYNPDVVYDTNLFLSQFEPLFPGISAQWNGRVIESKPHISPNYGSAYGNYRPGQYQLMCQYERVRQGNVFFAGEHTSLDFFGFMEGGANEGWLVAADILRAMGLRAAA